MALPARPVPYTESSQTNITFCVHGEISPLLANILLDDLDRELERRGHRFARYADDVLVLVNCTML